MREVRACECEGDAGATGGFRRVWGNADGREQRKKEEVTMVSKDTCLPPNYPHDDVHRCQLPSAFPSQASFSPLLTRVSMPPADTAKRSLQPRSGPSVAPKTHQTLRPSHLQPLSNLRVIVSRSTDTGFKKPAQICRRDGEGDGDEDGQEGGVQDTGLIPKDRAVHHREHLGAIHLPVPACPAARQ